MTVDGPDDSRYIEDNIVVDRPIVSLVKGYNPGFRGNSITLSCDYKLQPLVEHKWKLTVDMEKTATILGHLVTLNKVDDTMDKALLYCQLWRVNSTWDRLAISIPYEVQVINSQFSSPIIRKHHEKRFLTEGDDVTIICDYYPSTEWNLSWNTTIGWKSHSRIDKNGLTIFNITRHYESISCEYRDKINNKLVGTATDNLNVFFMEQPALTPTMNKTWNIMEGIDFTFACNVNSRPKFPSYSFMKNNKIITHDLREKILTLTYNKFTIFKADKKDSGYYSCRTLSFGFFNKTSAQYYLIVQEKKSTIHPIIYAVCVIIPLLLIALACVFCKCTKLKGLLRRKKDTPVINFNNNNKSKAKVNMTYNNEKGKANQMGQYNNSYNIYTQ